MAQGDSGMVTVVHRDKDGREHTYTVRGDQVRIGRSSDSDVCILSQFVSRRHALLVKSERGWVYRDLDSTSGSFLQGMRIREIPLPFGSWIHLGSPDGHSIRIEPKGLTESSTSVLESASKTEILRTIDLEHSRYVGKEPTTARLDAVSTRRLGSLYQLSGRLTAARDRDKMYQITLETVLDQLPGERAALILDEPGMSEPLAVATRVQGQISASFTPSRGLVGQVMQDRVGLVSRDAPSDERLAEAHTLAFQMVRSVMAAPLTSLKRTWGAIYVDTLTVQTPFDDEMLEFLLAVGRQLGLIVESMYLLVEQERMIESMMEVLAASIDARDGLTAGHSGRVAKYSRRLAERMGWDRVQCKRLYWAALLHDYGKIGIDDAVLRKPGALSTQEFKHIRLHPQLTHDILKRIHFPEGLEEIPFIAATHHERLDGAGYPFGLSGEDFPDGGQIIGICDVFDALTQKRHYREPMALEKVIAILEEGRVERWKPEIVDAMRRYVDEELVLQLAGKQSMEGTPLADRVAASAAEDDGG